MISWQTMRFLFFIPLLILGVTVFALVFGARFSSDKLAFSLPGLSATPTPIVSEVPASPIVAPRPLVNPVLIITFPARSLFEPGSDPIVRTNGIPFIDYPSPETVGIQGL